MYNAIRTVVLYLASRREAKEKGKKERKRSNRLMGWRHGSYGVHETSPNFDESLHQWAGNSWRGDPPLLIMSRKLLTRRPAMMFYNRLMSWKIRKEIRHCIIYHNELLGWRHGSYWVHETSPNFDESLHQCAGDSWKRRPAIAQWS